MCGKIEIIVGPMFSGKTEELFRRIRREEIANNVVLLIKSNIDSRSNTCVSAHNSNTRVADICISHSDDLKSLLDSKDVLLPNVVAIDELQFFDNDMVDYINKFKQRGVKVIATGLDMDYRGIGFPIVGEVMCLADKVDKITAICNCGKDATRTFKKVPNGKRIEINDSLYIPLCFACYQKEASKMGYYNEDETDN